jgi:O-antigen/teichoic acid export membrane protein
MASSPAARLLAHGGVYTLSRLASLAVGVALLPLYARQLGADGFGVISLMTTVGAFLGLVLVQGLPASWFRLRFDEPDATGVRALETTIVWYLAASGAAVVAVVTLFGDAVAAWVTPGIPYLPLGLLTAVAAFANAFPSLYERKLQVDERPVAFGAFSLSRAILSAGLVIVFVAAWKRGARGAIEATTLAACLAAAVSLFLIRPRSPRHVSRPRLARSLSYGLPLVPHSLAGMTNDVIDRLLLNAMLGLSAVGVYSMGYRVAAMGQVVAVSLNQAFGPVFIRTLNGADQSRRNGDAAAADAALRRVGRLGLLTVAGVACVVLAIAAVAREVLMVLATPAFGDSWKVVAPVGAGIVAWACYFPFSQAIFYNPARVRWLMVVTTLAALTNIGANVLLIPRWGIMGAASATLVSDTVLALAAFRFAQSSTYVPYARARWLTALACAAAGLAGLWALDARVDALAPRLALKVLWAAAAALLTLRAAQVDRAALRQLWRSRSA